VGRWHYTLRTPHTTHHCAPRTTEKTERPRTSAVSIQKAPPTSFFFPPPPKPFSFKLYFQAFLSRWSSKTPKEALEKKIDVKIVLQKNEKNSMSFFP
jgi:hypothetical protein